MKKYLIALAPLFYGIAAFAQIVAPKTALPQIKSEKQKQAKLDSNISHNNTTINKTDHSAHQSDSVYCHLPDARERQPIIIVNSNIITGLGHINPNDISSLTVLKDGNAPANLANLSRFGIIMITLKKEVKIETNTFSDIKKRFNIDGKARFAVDGYFVDDENMLISAKDINEINLTWKKANDASSDVIINIWMLAPEARKGFVYKPNPNDKPGTIYIRGLASK